LIDTEKAKVSGMSGKSRCFKIFQDRPA